MEARHDAGRSSARRRPRLPAARPRCIAWWRRSSIRTCGMWPRCPGRTRNACARGCRGIFEHIGLVPSLLVFDNATGAAHRVAWDKAGAAGVFQLFCEHHRVEARFCNPRSGWEKGSVENAVGFLRRNLMVPQPSAEGYRQSARWLLGRCDEFAGRGHCRLGRTVSDLFGEDRDAMVPLPRTRFDAVEWESRKADKEDVVAIDGHRYLAGPSWRG